MSENFTIAQRNLEKRKKRTFLTVLGIIIGIAAIFTLFSLSQGLKDSVREQFNKIGADKIIISPGGSMTGAPGAITAILDDGDLNAMKRTQGVKQAGGVLYKSGRATYKGQTNYVFLTGIELGNAREMLFQVMQAEAIDGRLLKEGDRGNVVVGYDHANNPDFYDKPIAVGSKITLEEKEFRVVGVNKKLGNPQDDQQVYLSLDDARSLFNDDKSYSMIVAQIDDANQGAKIAEDIKNALRRHRGEKKNEESFDVQTTEDLLESFNTILVIVQVFLLGVAAISLIVGALGILNTMYTAVMERTREIGVMKAIGAQRHDIVQIFLYEAAIIGFFGGLIGVLIGFGLSKLIEAIAAGALGPGVFMVSTPWWLFAGSIAFAVLLGAGSGVLPARQAADLKPVEALRYE